MRKKLRSPESWASWIIAGDDVVPTRQIPGPLLQLHARIMQAIEQDRMDRDTIVVETESEQMLSELEREILRNPHGRQIRRLGARERSELYKNCARRAPPPPEGHLGNWSQRPKEHDDS